MGVVARSGAYGAAAGLLLLICVLSSSTGMNVSAQTPERTTVSFDVVTFDLPGPGWQQTTATPRQIGYIRKMGDGKFQSIAFWPVTFPPSLQGRSQKEHTSAIFDIERQKPRYEGRWEGFVEGAREIAGRQFPTMSFTNTLAAQRFVADGLFVLYFPDDFDQRRKFFSFMWLDGHRQDQPGTGLEALDAIISSVKVKPIVASPLKTVANDWKIVPGERIGDVSLGMSEDEVVKLLGPPSRSRKSGEFTVHFWATPQMEEVITSIHLGSVQTITIVRGPRTSQYRTEKGLSFGATMSQVREAYGDSGCRIEDVSSTDRVLAYPGLGIRFLFSTASDVPEEFRGTVLNIGVSPPQTYTNPGRPCSELG